MADTETETSLPEVQRCFNCNAWGLRGDTRVNANETGQGPKRCYDMKDPPISHKKTGGGFVANANFRVLLKGMLEEGRAPA